jgi:hypothetical protein
VQAFTKNARFLSILPKLKYTVTCTSDYRRGLDWRIDLLTTHKSLTTNNYNILPISTLQITPHYVFSVYIHQSLLGNSSSQWLFLCNVFTRRFLVTYFSNGDSSASVARRLTLHSWTLNCTALTRWTEDGRSSHIASERIHREHRLQHLFYCCVTSQRTRMLRTLHSNGYTRHVSWHLLYCCMWALPSNGWCLPSHLLVTGLYATIQTGTKRLQPRERIFPSMPC